MLKDTNKKMSEQRDKIYLKDTNKKMRGATKRRQKLSWAKAVKKILQTS